MIKKTNSFNFESLVHRILAAILGEKEYKGGLTSYMASGSVRLFFLYCAAFLLVFISNYLLVKVSAAEDYGAYIYTFNLLYLLSGFCLFGTDTLLVKKIPVYNLEQKHSELKGMIVFALTVSVIVSLIVAIASELVARFTVSRTGLQVSWLIISLVTLVMLAVTSISQASLQGLKKIVFSQVAEKIIRPLLMIIVLSAFFFSGKPIALKEMIWLNIGVIGIATLVAFLLLQKSLKIVVKPARASLEKSAWFSSSASFFLLNLLYVFNSRIDIFLLGLYKTNEQVGAYNIALRLSEIIGFSLVIVNFVLAPLAAMLYEAGDMARLQKIVTRCSRVVLLAGLSLLILIVLFRKQLLSFFEVDSLPAQAALIILCSGQFINILAGSVGTLLNMTGFQKFSIISLVVSVVVNILLNVILTPEYGLTGTAIAAASSLFIWNALMCVFVNRKLKIKTTALGFI